MAKLLMYLVNFTEHINDTCCINQNIWLSFGEMVAFDYIVGNVIYRIDDGCNICLLLVWFLHDIRLTLPA